MYQKTILDNGLRIVTSTMPHTRSLSICFFIGVGSRYESEAQAGGSHFIEHLNFRGTARRPSAKDISLAVEEVGGSLNGGTNKELTLYWARVAQPHFLLALDVLVDMLLHSRFDPADIEQERQVILEELNMTKDSPSQQVNLLIDQLLWPGHPLGWDTIGTKESVTAMSRGMMLEYIENKYLPETTVVAIAGNIQHEEAVTAVSQAMGNWSNQHLHPEYAAYKEQLNQRLQVERRDTEQAHLCLGLPGLPLLHPKRYVLDLLNTILGGGMSSRLFTEIRDKLGLAYSISSAIDHFHDTGAITVYAGVEPKNLPVAIKAILEQFSQLKEPISYSELSKAKELTKGQLWLRMEDTRSVTGWIGGQEILTGNILTVDQVVAIIDAITTEELEELARELFTGEYLRLAVVGPLANEESLEELLTL
ncbi:MAG: pitrilysin family protein [Dehalococcoidales bacterium]|nr:pitrilysin family protein [Dehalococcoidales bacterium]